MKRLLIYSILLLLCNCKFSNNYLNRESDKVEAEKICQSLFLNIQNGDYNAPLAYFHPTFFEATPTAELISIFARTKSELGHLGNYKLISWNTKVSEGAINKGIYDMLYRCTFRSKQANVRIVLQSEEDNVLKIISFVVNANP